MKWLNNYAFPLPLSYILCTNERQFRRHLKKLGIPEWKTDPFIIEGTGAAAHFYKDDNGSTNAIVTIDTEIDCKKTSVYALLVHEAVHIWQEIRELMHEKNPSSEFEAWTIQWISQNLMDSYNEQMKTRRLGALQKT